ncbi:MAG: hypothetical protein PUG43_06195 [Clostridiales bacterium]|nr:hypothetical protein [Clostridiales bacterium]
MIKLLVGIRIRLMMSAMFGKKKKAMSIGLVAFGFIWYFLLINAFIIPITFVTTDELWQKGIAWIGVAISFMSAFVLCFIGSVFMAYQQIYESKDNEMLLAMPIKPGHILISRIFAIAGFNMLYALPFLTGTVAGYFLGRPSGSDSGVVFVLFIVIDYVAMVVFATMLTSIFAWLLSMILGRVQNKTLISTIIYVGFFIGYFYVILNMQSFGDSIARNGEAIAESLNNFAKPVFLMAAGATGHNIGYTLIYLAITLIPSCVIFGVMQKSYVNILLMKKQTKKTKYRDETAAKRSVFKALLQKEISRFFGTPMYFLNYGTSIIFPAMVIVYLFIKKNDYGSLMNFLALYGVKSESVLPYIVAMGLYAFVSTGSIMTSASINLEGKNLWILKSLPITTREIFASKVMTPFVCLLPFFELLAILNIFLFSMDSGTIILMLLMPIVTMAFFSQFGLYINLKHYKLDWLSENEAFKRAGGPTIASFSAMGSLIILIIVYVFIFSTFIDFYGFMWIMIAGLLIGSGVLYSMLKSNGRKLFMKVE